MARIPYFDPISYLASKKFPLASSLRPTAFKSSDAKAAYESQAEASRKFIVELKSKPLPEINKLVAQQQLEDAKEQFAKDEREESERYFNLPHNKADFTHWCKAASWTLDEAVALSFGRAPEQVKWEEIKTYVHVSRFAAQYQRRRDLALRARGAKQLYDPVLPSIFVAWLKRLGIEYPEEAARVLGAHKNTVRRWFNTRSLPVIAETRPHLVLGRDLKAYLGDRESVRTRLGPGQCYCLGCKAAREPALDMVEISSSNGLTVNVRGLCPDCERFMYRRVTIAKLADIFPALKVPPQEAERHLKVRDGSCSHDDSGDP